MTHIHTFTDLDGVQRVASDHPADCDSVSCPGRRRYNPATIARDLAEWAGTDPGRRAFVADLTSREHHDHPVRLLSERADGYGRDALTLEAIGDPELAPAIPVYRGIRDALRKVARELETGVRQS